MFMIRTSNVHSKITSLKLNMYIHLRSCACPHTLTHVHACTHVLTNTHTCTHVQYIHKYTYIPYVFYQLIAVATVTFNNKECAATTVNKDGYYSRVNFYREPEQWHLYNTDVAESLDGISNLRTNIVTDTDTFPLQIY